MVDERARTDHGLHVLAALGALDRRIDGDMRALLSSYVPGLRGSYGRILDSIADEGSRPSALVAGSWITKQAVGKRIRELEAIGWVSVHADAEDRRAVIVQRTPVGDRVRGAAREAIRAMEERWAEQVGARRYATFRAVLDELGGAPYEGLD